MVQWQDYYVDDNETIYVHVEESSASINDLQGFNLTWGLPDLAELSGQSTVFLNSVHFKLNGWTKDTAEISDTVIYCVAGIIPEGTVATATSGEYCKLENYQQVKGWPLKGSYGTATVGRGRDSDVLPADWQGATGRVTWTKTFKPRTALLLSRLQQICFNAAHTQQGGFSSGDWDGSISMDLQLKRGD